MRSLLLALIMGLLLGASIGCIPVRVTNTPEWPVPTAPMAQEVPQEDGSVLVNPQLGPPPTMATYESPPFPWGSLVSNALSGNWVGVGTTLLAGGTALYAERQRRSRNQARAEREELANMHPKEAQQALATLKKKE